MSYPVFLTDSVDGAPGDQIEVHGDEARHAVTVKRIRVGETVVLADGRGAGVEGVVVAADKVLRVEIAKQLVEREPKVTLVGVQALAKGERSDLAVELLTETGASEIIAWSAERSIVRWNGERGAKSLEKWRLKAREASKQSRRLRVPEVTSMTTEHVLERITGRTCFVLHEAATLRLAQAVTDVPNGEIIVITGPEGGISERELAQFCAAGATPVLLTDHVLRTSTAGGVALAQIQAVKELA